MKPLMQRKESTRYPGLFVKKYTRRVFFDNLWDQNPELMEARGHVEDRDGNVVVRPFTKIFNRGENGTDIDSNERCLVTCKINGFMAAATYVPAIDEVVISTTGSLDSEFVTLAEKYLGPDVKEYIKKTYDGRSATYMFEICDETDPHIIAEEQGAYLIGCRYVDSEKPYFSAPELEAALDLVAKMMRVKRPDWFVASFNYVKEVAAQCKHEGFVVYGQESKTALKIKSPYYLALKAAARKKDIMSLNKEIVDEEFYPLVDHLATVADDFNSMEEQDRLNYMRKFLEN